MMKPFLFLATATLLHLDAVLAAEVAWTAEVTATRPDGTRNQSTSAFIPSANLTLPVDLGDLGSCTIDIRPEEKQGSEKNAEYANATFTIQQPTYSSGKDETIFRTIYFAFLPIVKERDIALLKCREASVSVRFSEPKGEWWVGSWKVAPEASRKYAETSRLSGTDVELIAKMAEGFNGAILRITPTEVIVEREGSRDANAYTVAGRSTDREVTLRTAVSSDSYTLHSGFLVVTSKGDAKLPLLFSPVETKVR